MNEKKALGVMVSMVFLLMCIVSTPTVSAKAERWYHDIIKDVSRDTQMTEIGDMRLISEWTLNSHLVYNDVFDGRGNLHVNYKYVSIATVHNEVWLWNGEDWAFYMEYIQKLHSIGGNNELNIDFFAETQTARQIDIHNEKFKMVTVDPLSGEETTYEYTVIGHLMMKWLNGELQFEMDWEIVRPEI